jgi:hypothetical protein
MMAREETHAHRSRRTSWNIPFQPGEWKASEEQKEERRETTTTPTPEKQIEFKSK